MPRDRGATHVAVWGVFCLVGFSLSACSGGGGGSGLSGGIVLTGLSFPDATGQNGAGPGVGPTEASLIQQVVFTFSGVPDANSVTTNSLRIRDTKNFPVPGEYQIEGNRVVFTPTLPRTPIIDLGDDLYDLGGAALQPTTSYWVEVSYGSQESLSNLRGIAPDVLQAFHNPSNPRGILAAFATTGDPTRFLDGWEVKEPHMLSVTPADNAQDVAPFLKSDPGKVFGENRPFDVTFDAPVNPSQLNVSDQRFRLIDLDDLDPNPSGLPLGVNVEVVENLAQRSTIRITPAGILPFDHMLALEIPEVTYHLSEQPGFDTGTQVVAVVQTQVAPDDPIADFLDHPFENLDLYDADASSLGLGSVPAEWDKLDAGVLKAAVVFPGGGELGRFVPSNIGKRDIFFDTTVQPFPLFDGSTPDAQPGTIVYGGVFNFTEITIPVSVTIKAVGPNPLILTATGSVSIKGKFDVHGLNGTSDSSYDSAVLPVPGGKAGVGAGDGGTSHPTVFYPPDQVLLMNQVSPAKGEDGFSPQQNTATHGPMRGGEGGLTVIRDDPSKNNPEIDCNEFGQNGDDQGAGGGGGVLFPPPAGKGKGRNGNGNMNPQPDCTHKDLGTYSPKGGKIGSRLFKDGDQNNDFIGVFGEVKNIQGGQGGGGGGSKNEGYYCGFKYPWGRDEFFGAFPDTTSDARGGGGGGGGGAVAVMSLGPIVVGKAAQFTCFGGRGGGGEILGNSRWGGPGGGGSGGAVILKSAASITIEGDAEFNMTGGQSGVGGNSGTGGHGIVQFQVPYGQQASAPDAKFRPDSSVWVDQDNLNNPVEFSPVSIAVSKWIDVGRVITRGPQGSNPVFEFSGTDGAGFVVTDLEGFIPLPETKPFSIHYLGRIDPNTKDYYPDEYPRANWVPPETTVKVEFQSADAIEEGSKEIDPGTVSLWRPTISVGNGRQFIRFMISFNLTKYGGEIKPEARRPEFRDFRLGFSF